MKYWLTLGFGPTVYDATPLLAYTSDSQIIADVINALARNAKLEDDGDDCILCDDLIGNVESIIRMLNVHQNRMADSLFPEHTSAIFRNISADRKSSRKLRSRST